MRVMTKAYGEMDVDERQKLTFASGLFGFEELRDFVLLDAEQQPFYWLQSVESPETAFILVNPFLFRPDYELDISDDELLTIGLDSPEKALIFAIVTIPASGPITVNLQGPLVVNRDNHHAKQAVLTDSRWTTRHDLMAELEGKKC
jgi:flagellar assembly factor FliW